MRRGERWFWIAGSFLLSVICLTFVWQGRQALGEAAGLRQSELALRAQLSALEARSDLLQAENQALRDTVMQNSNWELLSDPVVRIPEVDMKRLRAQGLKDPANDLINDLVKHPDLIPLQPVLGGKMRFSPGNLWVITEDWVIAFAEDGHRGARLLLRFSVQDGVITWSLVDVGQQK